jgi:membrane associated rhomboid family serine protease
MSQQPPRSGPITNIAQTALPPRGRPIFTVAMLVAIVAIHAYVSSLSPRQLGGIYFEYALTPVFLQTGSPYAFATLVTHAFLHGSWAHVLANSYALFLFGMLSERFLGTGRVILVYFASAIGGGLLFVALDPFSDLPLVGASGAISGLFGAAILSAPERSRRPLMTNAVIWLALNVGLPAMATGGMGPRIAWEAHLGGFAVGLVLGWVLRVGMARVTVGTTVPSPAPTATSSMPTASSPASKAGAKKPEPFNPVQRR